MRVIFFIFFLVIAFQSENLYGQNDTTINLVTDSTVIEESLKPYFQQASHGFSLQSLGRGLLGILFLVGIAFLFSTNRSKINWRLVFVGITMQTIIGILVLKVPFFQNILKYISKGFLKILSFTQDGVMFLFGNLDSGLLDNALVNFAVVILPTVIFFSALTSLLFYFGILQKIVYVMAWIMKKTMGLSGSEALAASGNIFLGQTEAPLLIKPYIEKMTKSEIMCLMTGGMATIAGGVLAAYIKFLGGDDPAQQLFFANHLITASVMSAPAAIVVAKMLVPESEPVEKEMKISKEKMGSNFLEAISNGTTEGLRLAVNVGAMLLVFIAMVSLFNFILEGMIGNWTGLNAEIVELTNGRFKGLNMQFILGYIGAPIAWMIGIPNADMLSVGQLLGQKTVLNEFYAYTQMGIMKSSGVFVHEKSIIMTTYILCGFANFASIGIQIGGIGSLAPNKRSILSNLGFRAMLGGTLACLLTAAAAGILF